MSEADKDNTNGQSDLPGDTPTEPGAPGAAGAQGSTGTSGEVEREPAEGGRDEADLPSGADTAS